MRNLLQSLLLLINKKRSSCMTHLHYPILSFYIITCLCNRPYTGKFLAGGNFGELYSR